jgi:hypothetical protein
MNMSDIGLIACILIYAALVVASVLSFWRAINKED